MAATKRPDEFRNYAADARSSVKDFYRLNHANQTLDFVLGSPSTCRAPGAA